MTPIVVLNRVSDYYNAKSF